MTLREIILAFLAARYPAAFPTSAITARINSTGLLDKQTSPETVAAELTLLTKKFGYVETEVNHLTGDAVWTATTTGIRQWHLSGQLHVG